MNTLSSGVRGIAVPRRTISDRMVEVTAWLAHHPLPHPHVQVHVPHPHLPHVHVPHPHVPPPRPRHDSHDRFMESARMAREMRRL